MKKRLLTAVLLLAMALCLCACGDNASDTNKDTEKQNTQQESQANNDSEEESEPENVDDGKIEYKVILVDANGAPVANTMVQVCNASTCFAPVATDENGVATFKLEESDEYKAKLLSQSDDEYVYFESGSTELTLTVTE